MNPFEMVVLIVAISAVASIFRAKYGIRRHRGRDQTMPMADPDTDRMREELRALKERVAVLERIATDGEGSASLERQIEALRSRE
ncbi:hypothetical protein [Sphingomonas profundi]|uniref:hypothetical protein n=1 Tax=Alterirhizorhabdus profundi TaxID=2681549 RepID=UPI0012E8D995|nr:hypothetical protein [Sphingomonas profundi]